MKIRIDDRCDIVFLTRRREEIVREYGEGFGFVDIKPVTDGSQNIHDEDKSCSNICCGKPWACKRATKVRRDGGPVDPNRTYP